MTHRRFLHKSAAGSVNVISALGKLAGAAALLCVFAGNSAHALGLGRITVQSALGETLRAEIDVPEINADEAASLKVGVASVEAFKSAGLEYTPAVAGVLVTLQKRPDGRSFLRLTSSRPVTEPFVDLVLEANWSSGRVVRDYTMLFDPPNLRQAAPGTAQTTAPIFSRSAAPPAVGTALPPSFSSSSPPVQAPTRPTQATKASPQPPAPKGTAATQASNGQKVEVKPGDTAGKIAAENKPANVSLDQMLVAMLLSNPDAFIRGNINRLKSGAVLNMPAAEEVGAVPPSEATRTIVAQSKDFNSFRQKLATGIPPAQVDGATRKAEGKVQAKVEDRTAVATAPDKLTLSKGAVQGTAAAEDKIAKEKQAKDASSRVAELTKNIGELNKIAGTTPSAPAPAAAAASAVKPSVVPAAPALPALQTAASPAASPASANAVVNSNTTITASAAITTPTAALTSAAASVSSPAPVEATASQPVAANKPVVAPPPPAPSLIDDLTDNPLVLPGLGVVLALLAGFGFYRYKKRSNQASVDSSFLESRLQPDSFFGASGGQRIDTTEGGSATGSSLVYSPSQLDAAGDVDPVAEADVYLAYGRDLQAEEILKEALRTNPSRVAIHAKLLEIYAKRRDLKSFGAIAADAFSLTRGNGTEWAYICELGRDLDPNNPTYQPGGQPAGGLDATGHLPKASSPFSGTDTIPQRLEALPEAAAASVDFDLDLDFSSNDEPVNATPAKATVLPDQKSPTAVAPAPMLPPSYLPEPTVAMQAKDKPSFDSFDMDFGSEPTVAFSLPTAPAVAPAAPKAQDSGMLEFDMGSLSLDLDAPITESPSLAKVSVSAAPTAALGPLETKLSLAEEFHALGDSDGARSLANEVVAQADGALKSKAQAFLNALS